MGKKSYWARCHYARPAQFVKVLLKKKKKKRWWPKGIDTFSEQTMNTYIKYSESKQLRNLV